jgi:cyclopropane-fatty-acyl-phospholipid synthase
MTIDSTARAGARWPGLDMAPSGARAAVSAVVARRLFTAAVHRLPVTVVVETPHGHRQVLGQGGPTMTVHRPEEFFARLGRHGLIGFGEAYMTEAWDADDLAGFLTVLAADLPTLVPSSLQKARALVVARPPREQKSTAANSRNNIAHHYDLSNELFELFLDRSLSYSSARFPGHLLGGAARREDLEAAQHAKIDRLLDQACVGEGTRLLEIGSGWGELAIRAARRGATVRTITLSVEQKDLADRRVAAAAREMGFASDRVSVELCDYRHVGDSGELYDAIVSVEMIEAVGWQYWQTYFATLDAVLAPGGHVAIQAITMPHDRMLATRNTYTWINKYVFPGGFLPSVQVIEEITRRHTGLRLVDQLPMGQHYAETLRLWDEAFRGASEQVLALGFDETFLRMWHFYLEYARAGFGSGYIDVNQLTFSRQP